MADQRQCTYCHETKAWVWNGQRLRDGSKVYTDVKKSRWAGKRCPDCEHQRVKSSLKFSRFERDMVVRQLRADGYRVLSSVPPVRVEKDGKVHDVNILHAQTLGDKILVEDPVNDESEVTAVVFQTVRVFSKERLVALKPQLEGS